MNWHNLLGDLPAMLVALALIGADVLLHLSHDAAGAAPFDASIPVLVAVYIGGRVAVSQSIAANGKATAPPVSVSSEGPSKVSVGVPAVHSDPPKDETGGQPA